MRINYLLFFYACIVSASAQQWEWALKEKVNLIAADAAGNQVILHDSTFKKLSPQGSLLWQKQFSGDLESISMTAGEAGNYYLSGTFTDFSYNGQHFSTAGSLDIFLAKIDPLGNLVWHRRYGGTSANTVNRIHYGKKGGVYLCGRLAVGSQLGDSTYVQPGFFILGADEAGNIIMQRKYNGAAGWELGTDSTGNLYVLGGGGDGDSIRFENGLFQRGYFPGFHFMAKYTPAGNLLWAKDFGQNYYAPHRTLAVEPSGTFYLSMWQRYAGFDLSRYNAYGVNLWTRNFDDVYGDCSSLLVDRQNDVWVTGGMYNCDGGCQRPFLWKINENGNTLYSAMETYATRSNGIAFDGGQNFYVYGVFDTEEHFGSTTLSGSAQTAYLAKFSTGGITTVKNEKPLADVKVYPNPTNGYLMIDLPELGLPARFNLYNAQGKCGYRMEITTTHSSIDLQNQSPGVYLVEVETSSGVLRKKVILEGK